MKNALLVVVIALGTMLATACGAQPTPDTVSTPLPATGATEKTFESPLDMPNPASKFCRDQGFQLELRTDASGTTGYCVFPDGSECEEWAYYRGECGPADATLDSPLGLPNPASAYCEEQGYTLEMRTEANGTTGYCVFADATECEEWAFYRGECAPGTPGP
jgi:putative hemolysin